MAVLNPVKLIIDNYDENMTEELEAHNNMENEELGVRKLSFSRELYIEREDFMEEPVKKYFRMYPGNSVRLMYAYIVTCTGFDKDEDGNITAVHCTYEPDTKSGMPNAGRKVKGTIHWVDSKTAVNVPVRLFENIIDEEKGAYDENGDLNLNPASLTLCSAYLEKDLINAKTFDRFQFVRNGYFCVDSKDSSENRPVFNRIVSLKSSFKLPSN